MRLAVQAEGSTIIDSDGNAILDGISSWWVITHGHRYGPIMETIRAASKELDQIIFAEFTHEYAERLARGLIAVAPPGLRRVFYSDSGSTAVEVGIKMALGHFHNQGIDRRRIAVLEDGYHGDTIGTMSAGERGVFNAPYDPLLFSVERLPFPGPGAAEEQATLDAFEALCREGGMAAILLEPLVLGAGGMRFYSARVLKELARIARTHGVLIIADEVMTGWGRTGTRFACEQADLAPDILCTSKGLTGGAIPLAATLATEEIFQSHYSRDRRKTFFHSSSYTANPMACAAGVANLKVWADEPVQDRINAIAAEHARRLARFENNPNFANIRQAGTIAAMDLVVPGGGYLAECGPKLRAFFREKHLLLRPLGNVLYIMAPYCVTPAELDRFYDGIEEGAEYVLKDLAR
jgi:adenosylmethionine-8-amino-7-oxononanoate aminotransferase